MFFRKSRTNPRSHEDEQAKRIAQLTKSRRAVADAYENERSRIERDLHDGCQQYLVAASIKLGEAALDATGETAELISAAKNNLDAGLHSLRETVHGIRPQVLEDLGLAAALRETAGSLSPKIEVYSPHPLPKLSSSVLAAGYFFGVEAMNNAVKHASSAAVSVLITADSSLYISVVDRGPGGARFVPGYGLAGMRERLAAFGGQMELSSPGGGPTRVKCSIPLLLKRGQSGIGEV